jgi:hypothetical protein
MQTSRTVLALVASAFVAGAIITTNAFQTSPLAAQTEKPAKKPAVAPEKKKELGDFMRQKLSATNFILEGILTEDFVLLTKGAKQLQEMSHLEKWRVSNDLMYRNHSEDFHERVDKLLKAAKEESVDAAALAYFDTTMSCIECHKWVRRVLIAGQPSKVTQ